MSVLGYKQWDEYGTVVMDDTTNSVFRILGVVDTNGSNGSVTDAGFSAGTFWFTLNSQWDLTGTAITVQPSVSLVGTTMSWTYSTSTTLNTTIAYGIR